MARTKMNYENYAERCIDGNGDIIPFERMQEAELRAQYSAQHASALAAQAAEAKKSDLEKSIEVFQREADHARRNDDHSRYKFLKTHLETLREQHATEQAARKKAELFANDRLIQLVREEADAVERSGHVLYPHATAVERNTLVAIARSGDYPDPQSQYADYRELADMLSDREIAAERAKANDAEQSATQNMAERAESQARIAQHQLAKARHEN
jgi:hypothetical protein